MFFPLLLSVLFPTSFVEAVAGVGSACSGKYWDTLTASSVSFCSVLESVTCAGHPRGPTAARGGLPSPCHLRAVVAVPQSQRVELSRWALRRPCPAPQSRSCAGGGRTAGARELRSRAKRRGLSGVCCFQAEPAGGGTACGRGAGPGRGTWPIPAYNGDSSRFLSFLPLITFFLLVSLTALQNPGILFNEPVCFLLLGIFLSPFVIFLFHSHPFPFPSVSDVLSNLSGALTSIFEGEEQEKGIIKRFYLTWLVLVPFL